MEEVVCERRGRRVRQRGTRTINAARGQNERSAITRSNTAEPYIERQERSMDRPMGSSLPRAAKRCTFPYRGVGFVAWEYEGLVGQGWTLALRRRVVGDVGYTGNRLPLHTL